MAALATWASKLVDDFDVVDLLTKLTEKCVNLLGVSVAGVMLASPPGELRLHQPTWGLFAIRQLSGGFLSQSGTSARWRALVASWCTFSGHYEHTFVVCGTIPRGSYGSNPHHRWCAREAV
jgi:hypothetical protein